MKKILLSTILLLCLFFFFTNFSFADDGLVPCTNDCTLCHVVIGFQGIFEFFWKNVLLPMFLLAVTLAGVAYLVSSGSSKLMSFAKQALGYSLAGLVFFLCSWLIVNFIMLTLGYKAAEDSWYKFECDTTQTEAPVSTPGTSSTPETPETPSKPATPGTPNGDCGGLKTKGGSLDRCKEASPEMSSVMKCINDQLGSGSKAWLSLNSINRGKGCHGGGNCSGVINAVDIFGDQVAAAEAGKACGADTVIINNKAYVSGYSKPFEKAGDHYDHAHISVNNKKCYCDYKKNL